MIRRPPRSTRTDTLFPYTTLFRSVLLGASRVIRTLASSPNIRTFFDQNFANPVFIADPGLEYSTLPPASKIDDKGVYLFNRLTFYAAIGRASCRERGCQSV